MEKFEQMGLGLRPDPLTFVLHSRSPLHASHIMSEWNLEVHFNVIHRLLQQHPKTISGVEWLEEEHPSCKLRMFKIHFKDLDKPTLKEGENCNHGEGDKGEEETNEVPVTTKRKKSCSPLLHLADVDAKREMTEPRHEGGQTKKQRTAETKKSDADDEDIYGIPPKNLLRRSVESDVIKWESAMEDDSSMTLGAED
jgi:hypothetical protein